MIAVIFEVTPAPGRRHEYLAIASEIRSDLEKIEGFIQVERFQGLTDPDKLLSLSLFENEAAVKKWRETPSHRKAQTHGRSGLFANYKLRVAHVLRDYDIDNREQAPEAFAGK